MRSKELNSGIIYTLDNCIGCSKCISGCISLGANVVVENNEKDSYKVMVDPTKCILCGTCVEACVHKARTYRDDTDAFFNDLEKGEKISILVSPTLYTDYEKIYPNILGFLKDKGVNHIYNTAFGGDVMVWAYMNLIHRFGLSGVISQFCPVIVNYLEKHKPELLRFLMPVQSPVMCTAIYLRDYLKLEDKLAFISPCIASKYEIEDPNTYGNVTYNVTFERLMRRIEGTDISNFSASEELSYGLGALIPMSGGLSDNIERYIGFDEVLIQTSGPSTIFPYFDHYLKEVSTGSELPFLVDVLSCTNGCNFGTGTDVGVEVRNGMTFSAHRMKEKAYRSGKVSQGNNAEERLVRLNQHFAGFELSSFVRQYDLTRKADYEEISRFVIVRTFDSMYKDTEEKRHTDCGACGYRTCLDMAYAIATNVNQKENCINYSKERIRMETEKINNLLEEISGMNEELKKATQLKSNFLANMSHEIRTPMNAIIGMAEMALRGRLDDEERSYIQQIQSSGRSLLAIINDILDFSKIESGKMELNENEYTVMSLVNDTVNIILTRIGEKDITLTVDCDPNIPLKLFGDDIRIKQVLVNLANNAVKFTENGNVNLSIKYKRTENNVFLNIAVSDTGIGIKPEDLEKLFNSFQQVDSKRNRNVEGTGLGLAISRQFVILMNGQVFVDSEYGKGSTFSFEIPQKIIEDIPSASLKSSEEIKTACLVSNKYIRESLVSCLSHFGNVSNSLCKSIDELSEAYEQGAQVIFLEYELWFAQTKELAKKYPNTQTVVLTDSRKEVVKENYVRKLDLPLYALSVTAALNNEKITLFDKSHTEDIRFEAPGAHILVVDDNAINLTVAKGLLSPFHMQITGASGALEAIELLNKTKFDMVFMDHMMPDIDGVEATHMIREMGGDFETLPIIALTANAINNAREMFIGEGMNDFVAKPIEMRDITSKLRKWLPKEKIKIVTGAEAPDNEAKDENIPQIPSLNCKQAVERAGSTALYKIILADYYKVIDKKAELIERCEKEENIESYTIEVHALKSASRLIGADELASLAEFLEKCGHDKNLQPIRAQTAELLSQYRGLKPLLEPYAPKQSEEAKRSITAEELLNKLDNICTALDDFDIDAATEITEELKRCALSENEAMLCKSLTEAVEAMEYDEAVQIARNWQAVNLR